MFINCQKVFLELLTLWRRCI